MQMPELRIRVGNLSAQSMTKKYKHPHNRGNQLEETSDHFLQNPFAHFPKEKTAVDIEPRSRAPSIFWRKFSLDRLLRTIEHT
jgi:hypothetical protein